MFDALFVHLDDPAKDIQEAMFEALQAACMKRSTPFKTSFESNRGKIKRAIHLINRLEESQQQ